MRVDTVRWRLPEKINKVQRLELIALSATTEFSVFHYTGLTIVLEMDVSEKQRGPQRAPKAARLREGLSSNGWTSFTLARISRTLVLQSQPIFTTSSRPTRSSEGSGFGTDVFRK